MHLIHSFHLPGPGLFSAFSERDASGSSLEDLARIWQGGLNNDFNLLIILICLLQAEGFAEGERVVIEARERRRLSEADAGQQTPNQQQVLERKEIFS